MAVTVKIAMDYEGGTMAINTSIHTALGRIIAGTQDLRRLLIVSKILAIDITVSLNLVLLQ